jgi:hypothetical protein
MAGYCGRGCRVVRLQVGWQPGLLKAVCECRGEAQEGTSTRLLKAMCVVYRGCVGCRGAVAGLLKGLAVFVLPAHFEVSPSGLAMKLYPSCLANCQALHRHWGCSLQHMLCTIVPTTHVCRSAGTNGCRLHHMWVPKGLCWSAGCSDPA